LGSVGSIGPVGWGESSRRRSENTPAMRGNSNSHSQPDQPSCTVHTTYFISANDTEAKALHETTIISCFLCLLLGETYTGRLLDPAVGGSARRGAVLLSRINSLYLSATDTSNSHQVHVFPEARGHSSIPPRVHDFESHLYSVRRIV
jgi:hypothetical protein